MFKSGTSSEFTNLWCVGATPRFTVGAWAGNFDGRTVINKTGSIVPTQLVVDVLERLQSGAPAEFPRPAGSGGGQDRHAHGASRNGPQSLRAHGVLPGRGASP